MNAVFYAPPTPQPTFRLSATLDGRTATIEYERSGVTASELLEDFKALALALGYQPESWADAIFMEAEMLKPYHIRPLDEDDDE